MVSTMYICDCCGMEVDPKTLHVCHRELRTWKSCKSKTWEICENCLQRIQDAMEKEIEKLQSKE